MSYKDRKAITKDLRPIYQAATEDESLEALGAFDDRWGERYPMIAEMWRAHWNQFIPFFVFPYEIRRIIYPLPIRSRLSTASSARSSRPAASFRQRTPRSNCCGSL